MAPIASVIQYEGDNSTFVWKHPCEDFNTTSQLIVHTEWFKKMWKGKLDRMVANLKAEGVKDTPYEDRNW